jgi:hypothetical protein
MNPRVTDSRLFEQRDFERGSHLPPDYFERNPFATRWFHFLLGMCVGAGFCAVLMFAVFVGR